MFCSNKCTNDEIDTRSEVLIVLIHSRTIFVSYSLSWGLEDLVLDLKLFLVFTKSTYNFNLFVTKYIEIDYYVSFHEY